MPQIGFDYHRVEDWPPLAWLAVCRPNNSRALVYVGSGVETSPAWFCEAAWGGDFSDGDFDRVETVCGSGGRARDGQVTFVSSTSTVDRLHSLETDNQALISNSLPCLLQAADASLRPSYHYYNRDLHSITHGLHEYLRYLQSSAGPVQFTYFHNLVWDGQSLRVEPKPDEAPEFTSFSIYAGYLTTQLQAIADNAASPQRTQRSFRLLATVSTGYDSPTVATLAARCGCQTALSFDSANSGLPDSGAKIAEKLGLRVLQASRAAWRQAELPEIPIFASGQAGAVIFAGAAEHLSGTVLLTGFSGDSVWDLHNLHAGPHILRGDTSGLGLTEYRLWAGFLHCPLPFWGARKAAQIAALSNSAEMKPFVIADTDYNRPICRRIVEEAGIERSLFGMEKKAAEPYLWLDREFLTPAAYRDYLAWLRENQRDWLRHRRLPPLRSVAGDAWLNGLSSAAEVVARTCGRSLNTVCHAPPLLRKFKFKRLSTLHPPLLNLRRYWFPWAVDRAKQRYAALDSVASPDSVNELTSKHRPRTAPADAKS